MEEVIVSLLVYELLISLFPALFPALERLAAVILGNLAACLALALWGLLRQKGRMMRIFQRETGFLKETDGLPGLFCCLLMGGISASVLLNNVIAASGLMQLFPGVFRVQESIYAPPFWLQILGTGIVIPMAEEILYRGIVYKGIKERRGTAEGILWSAMIFGIMHGNVVQGLYAGLIGVFLAWSYERCGFLLAPVMVHMAANLSSILGTHWFGNGEGKAFGTSFYIVTVLMAAVFWRSAAGIQKRKNKKNRR